MIERIIKKDLCQIVSKAGDWKEAIVIASQPQLEEKLINQKYVDAMIQNVSTYGPYIVIAKDVAIAHASPQGNCLGTSLGLTRFTAPVDFHSPDFGPVRLLFTLAAADPQDHMQLLKEMIGGINTPEKVGRLVTCTDPVSLYSAFLKNTEVKMNENH